MSISDFLGDKGESRIEKFKRLSRGKTKEETRELEVKLLKPETIPKYTQKKADKKAAVPLISRTVKIVMPDSFHFEMMEKHFPVSGYIEKSISNPTLLCLLLEELEAGRIVYDKKKKEIRYPRSRVRTRKRNSR